MEKLKTITITDMLNQMNKGEVFSITVCSYDKKRKTGGKVKEYPEAIISTDDAVKDLRNNVAKKYQLLEVGKKVIKSKNPHHYKNYTRNIGIVQDGHLTSIVHKIHIPLVIKFNGLEVVP